MNVLKQKQSATTRPGKLLMVLVFGGLVLTGCVTGESSVLTGAERDRDPVRQLVWVGTGTAWRFENDTWVRTPDQDYEFLVRQNRYDGYWESLKVQNRTAADYDGAAGAADQQHFFRITYRDPDAGGALPVTVDSTYGNGSGTSDPDFERALLEIDATVSRLAPYNTIRIDQHYDYHRGVLRETVLLLEVADDGTEHPFVRIDEEARIFVPSAESVFGRQ